MRRIIKANPQPSVSEQRRKREREEMSKHIMDVAREMFVRDGYEAVTLKKIAVAIEYSPGIIYQYFRDKQDLISAIILKDLEDFRQHFLKCRVLKDPRERLVEMMYRYASWGIEHPNHYRLMLMPPAAWADQENKLRKASHFPLEEETQVVFYTTIKEAINKGYFKEQFTNPSLVAATLWAGLHGVILLEFNMKEIDRAQIEGTDMKFEERLETLKEVFLEGFLKDRGNNVQKSTRRKVKK